MSHALIVNDTIIFEGGLPGAAQRLEDGDWVCPLNGLSNGTLDEQQACGYFEVTTTARPATTATITHDRGVAVVNGLPVETWTARPKTADEIAADTASATREATEAAAVAYLDIAAPTTAQMRAQMQRLTALQLGTL